MNFKKASRIMFFCILFTVCFAVNAMAAKVTTTSSANVRQKASKTSSVLTVMPKGKTRTVLGVSSNGKWYKITMNGKTGYVHSARVKVSGEIKTESASTAKYSATYFKRMGVINWNGWRWTWYSQKVLPGGGLKIPGRHVDSNGYVCDKNDYICLASSTLSKGTVVKTPFGKKGKIYDSGCARGTLDVYVNW